MKLARAGVFAAAILALWPPTAVLAAGGEMLDEPASTLEFEYRLYAGGIPLGQVDFSARFRADSYTAASTLETVGIANALWQAKLEATSYGTFRELDLLPTNYDAFSIHAATNGGRQRVTLSYSDGLPTALPDPPYRRPAIVEADKRLNTLDPVSALVFAVTRYKAHSENPCEIIAPIYDGQRRYNISLDFVRARDVTMDNGLYSGEVQVCKLGYESLAGAEQIVFEGENVPDVFLWVATVQSPTDRDQNYVLPLRLWAETDFGVIVALLTGARLDGVEQTGLN